MIDSNSDLLFKALGDPTRRALFERLARGGEQSVGALTEHSGVSQPMVSRHLGALKMAGLITDRRDGRETRYSVNARGLTPLVDWMAHYGAFWAERFAALEDVLNRMDV